MADAELILSTMLDKIANEQNYGNPEIKLTKIPCVGANFTSFLYEATISSKGKEDLKLFAKTAAVGETMRAQAPMRVFEIEALFYQSLLTKYRKLEEAHGIEEKHRLVTPTCYGINSTEYEETVILEDLKAKGFQTLDRFELLTWEYASASVTELAKLHALSFAYAKDDPEGFNKDVATFKFEIPMPQEVMEQIFGGMVKRSLAMASEENSPKYAEFLNKFSVADMMEKYFLPNKTVVLRHGDYRASNLMHKENEDGSITVIPLDYQTVQAGDPLCDLFYLIFCGTDQKFRAQHWNSILTHYYEQVCAALKRLGLDPDEVYSKETFDEDLKEMMLYGLVVASTVLPLVTVEEAPEVGSDVDIETFLQMKHSSTYGDRLNGILSDYIEWGIL